jgi:hypothetical protein
LSSGAATDHHFRTVIQSAVPMRNVLAIFVHGQRFFGEKPLPQEGKEAEQGSRNGSAGPTRFWVFKHLIWI